MSKCMYCESSSFGPCSNSPHQKHEHSGMDEKKVCLLRFIQLRLL